MKLVCFIIHLVFLEMDFFSLGFYAAFMMIQDAEDDDCQQKMYAQIFNLDTWQFDKNCHKFFLIGLMYLKGYGVDQNQMVAIQYFDLSANFNFEPARWLLVCIKEHKNNIELFEFMNDWFNKSNDKLL
jgi:hypothetical protein